MIGRPELSAIGLSLLVAAAAVAGSLPFGVGLGWLLARRSFPGKATVETVVNLPLVLPPVVTGYLLLVAFGRQGPLGGSLERWLGVRLVFDWKGAAVAAAVVAFPLMVRSMRVAFAGVDGRLVEAARTLGAGPLDAFLTVALPLARHGVIAGCVLAFARSLGEFGATVMIAGNIPGTTQTIPLYLYSRLETPGGAEQAWPVITVSVALSAVALVVAERLERRVTREPRGRP
jgi:molybdate transport system permease protein